MHRSKNSFLEWLVYSLIFFFLYDIIWILADLPDFLQSVSGLYPELLVDFALCGLFSLSSLYLNRWLFKQQRFWREWQGHRVFVQNGLVLLGFNLLIAGGCELLLSLVAPKLMMQDIWGTSFLFGLIASLVALIHLSMHFSDMIVLKGKENLALQKRYLMLQLDPHFVFNSLSSLAGMIGEDPKMAEDYVVKLSHIYRYILQHIDKKYITLADGTDFIKSYIGLFNMRYDNAIVLHADDLHGDRNECILSLSLQLIIENAVAQLSAERHRTSCVSWSPGRHARHKEQPHIYQPDQRPEHRVVRNRYQQPEATLPTGGRGRARVRSQSGCL